MAAPTAGARLPNRSRVVDEHLDATAHSRKVEVQRLRMAILAADPQISETVKWNAPSFRYDDEDRVTFRLQPRDQVQLVLHRGVGVRADAGTFHFEDPDGLVVWSTPDGGVSMTDAEQTERQLEAVTDLVRRWVRA